MPEEGVLAKIKAKEDTMTELKGRWDDDRDLYYLVDYVMNDLNEKPTADVINITLNDPLTYAKRVIAVLSQAIFRTVIESRTMKLKDRSIRENFCDDLFTSANIRLQQEKLPDWQSLEAEYFPIRGRGVDRVLVLDNKGEQITSIKPLDPRFFVSESGANGMTWGSYKTKRSKAAIKEEYDKDISGKDAEVTEYWSIEEGHIYVGTDQVITQKNPFVKPPFVETITTGGSNLQDTEAREHEGESIFWPIRKLIPEMNRLASVLATINILSFENALQYENPEGEGKQLKKAPFGRRKVFSVAMGAGFKPMPLNDIKNATRLLYAILDNRMQRGSLSSLDYGNLTFPLPATGIALLMEKKGEVLIPIINAIAQHKAAICLMAIEQFKLGGLQTELGGRGRKNIYQASDLEGDYDIGFKIYSKSPLEDMSRVTVAQAYEPFASPETIAERILEFQNPYEERQKKLASDAEKMYPPLAMYNRCVALINEYERTKEETVNQQAWLAYHSLMIMFDVETAQQQQAQIAGGGAGQDMTGEKLRGGSSNGQPLLPLPNLSGDMGGGSSGGAPRSGLPTVSEATGGEE